MFCWVFEHIVKVLARIYSLKGSRFSTGVVPREVLRIVELNVGSADDLRGVCMPDGVDVPLTVLLFVKQNKISISICCLRVFSEHTEHKKNIK